jgi:hypothetical protein
MPATPADISAGIREARIETWSSATIQGRYPSARNGSDEPAEGFFDAAADAATAIAARGALIGAERRRFAVQSDDVAWLDPSLGLPTVTLIDPEQAVSGAALVCRVEVSLEDETTTFEVLV